MTSLLAAAAVRNGKKAGIRDADITGPSIPRMFGIDEMVKGTSFGIIPAETKPGLLSCPQILFWTAKKILLSGEYHYCRSR